MDLQDFKRWQPGYNVGNWVLDNQHKVIFGLCHEAIESVPDGSQGVAVRFNIVRNDLLGCVEEHFGSEEALLRHCRYPALDSHREEHLAFQVELAGFLMATALGRVEPADLHRFLSDWWCEHILCSDKTFAGSIHRIR